MDKEDLNEADAATRVSGRRTKQLVILILMWLASIIFSCLAVAVILAS